MWMIQNSQNPEVMLAEFIQNNPNSGAIAALLRNNNNLESIARNMAQQYGININDVINKLSQGQH